MCLDLIPSHWSCPRSDLLRCFPETRHALRPKMCCRGSSSTASHYLSIVCGIGCCFTFEALTFGPASPSELHQLTARNLALARRSNAPKLYVGRLLHICSERRRSVAPHGLAPRCVVSPLETAANNGSPCLGPKVLEFLRLDTRVEASKGACKPCCLPCRSAWVPGLLMQSLSCLVEHFEEHMTGRQNGSIDEAQSLGRRDKEG